MDDSAVVFVMMVVVFVMGVIIALFVGAMVLYHREDRAEQERRERQHSNH